MSKSKFMIKLYGGNISKTEILPKLSDDQIDEIYSQMITMDAKFDAFPGDKRQYVATVYSKMKEFLEQSNLSGGARTGRYQVDDEEEEEELDDEEEEEDESFKEKTGIPKEAVKDVGEKRAKRVKITEGERAGEEVDNPFATLPELASVSMQDILNTIHNYKEDLKPFRDAMVKSFNSESEADQHLFYFFKAPKLGDFENGPDLKDAYEQRVNFFKDIAKPYFYFGGLYDNYAEAGTLLEVYTYESGLTKNYNIVIPDRSQKKLELILQQTDNDTKYAKFDFTSGNNTLEIKGSFKSEPQSSIDKILLQCVSQLHRKGKNYHLFHLNDKNPDEYIKEQYNKRADKSPKFTFEMDINDFIDNMSSLSAVKDGKKTNRTLSDEIFDVDIKDILIKTNKNIPINKLFEYNNLNHIKVKKLTKILQDTLKANDIITLSTGKQIRFNPKNDLVNKVIKFKRGEKNVALKTVYKDYILTTRGAQSGAEFID